MRSGSPTELLYADDFAMVSESFEGLKRKLEVFKESLESKGLGVKVEKMKIIISFEKAGKVRNERNLPCVL